MKELISEALPVQVYFFNLYLLANVILPWKEPPSGCFAIVNLKIFYPSPDQQRLWDYDNANDKAINKLYGENNFSSYLPKISFNYKDFSSSCFIN